MKVVFAPRRGIADDADFPLRKTEFQVSLADIRTLGFGIGQKDFAGTRFEQEIPIRRIGNLSQGLRR